MRLSRLVTGAMAAGGVALVLVGCGGSGGSGSGSGGSGGAGAGGHAVLTVTPTVGLFDRPRTIVVSHLRAGERVTLDASTARVNGTWAVRFRGPVMLVSGGADDIWPSDFQADQLMSWLPHDGAAHVHLNYAGAGQIVLDVPYSPVAIDGGTLAATQAAHASDWPAVLRFIAGQ